MKASKTLLVIGLIAVVVAAVVAYLLLTRDRGRTWTVTIVSPTSGATSAVTFRDRDDQDSAQKRVARAIQRHCEQHGSSPDASGVVCSVELKGVMVVPVEMKGIPGRVDAKDATLTETIMKPIYYIRVRQDGQYVFSQRAADVFMFEGGDWDSLAGAADGLAETMVLGARFMARASDEASELP